MSDSIISSDGESIGYYIDGPRDAPVVILSNSLGTDPRLWAPQMPALTAYFRVLRYDSRGHGSSSAPQGDYTLERLGLDALDLIDALGIERVAFCGISLGGMVAQWLGYHAPNRIRSLAICNSSAYMGPPESWNARIASVRAHGMSAVAEAVLERWFTAEFLANSPQAVQVARAMLLATSPVGYAGSCAAIRDMDLRSLGAGIQASTLIIAGAHDFATPPAHAEALLAQIPNARLQMMPAAHLSNLETPQPFTETLLRFLREAGGKAPRGQCAEHARTA
jgi:3-oxoadipate enol-lactonase